MQPDNNEIFQKAFAAHQSMNLDEAARGYETILAVDPDHTGALQLMGVIELDRGNYGAALPLIEKSVRLAPDESQWQMNYGMILSKNGRTDEAVSAYNRAILLSPDCSDALIALGGLYYGTGKYKEALLNYYKVLCDNPGDKETESKYINTLRAMEKRKDAEKLLRWLEKDVNHANEHIQ